MPIHKIISNSSRVQLWMDSSGPRSDIDIIQLLIDQGGDHAKVALAIKGILQNDIDVRIARSQLPQEDEARQSDPNRPDFFWDKGDLVSRSVIVEDVVWDEQTYAVSLRRAR